MGDSGASTHLIESLLDIFGHLFLMTLTHEASRALFVLLSKNLFNVFQRLDRMLLSLNYLAVFL